jgi:opacity protein-like surface antigen
MIHFVKKAFLPVILVACGLWVFPAAAGESRLYLSGFMGFNLVPDQDYANAAVPVNGEVEYDDAPIRFGGALGFRLTNTLRIEAEAGYSSADAASLHTASASGALGGQVDVLSLMLNLIYDFKLDWPVVPFVTAGVGVGYFDADFSDGGSGLTQNSAGNDTNLVYQVGGGLKYPVGDALSMTGSYRYFGAEDLEFDRTQTDYSAHELRLGLEYDLPVGWDIAQ